jgi:hypothetical protein
MKLAAVLCTVVLGGGLVLAQEQSSGTVNSLSVDPQQNQKLSGSMGTETGQPNDVSRGADRNEQLGNPANGQISGQASGATKEQPAGKQDRSGKNKEVRGGSPSTNQNSASTNSGKAPRRTDNRDSSLEPSTTPH